MNKVFLYGNLGHDPDLSQTKGGTSVANLRVATNSRTKDPSGNWVDTTEWHSVVVWGTQAENCVKYLNKGRSVVIEGRLQTRSWTDSHEQTRFKTEVVADYVHFVGDKGRESDRTRGTSSSGPTPQNVDGGGYRSRGGSPDDRYNEGHAGRGAPNDDWGDKGSPF